MDNVELWQAVILAGGGFLVGVGGCLALARREAVLAERARRARRAVAAVKMMRGEW